ncbi:MAG: CAP domain-containing protein [Nannocystaceae bacterium]
MSHLTPLRPAASLHSCASPKPSPRGPLVLALAALAWTGCYSGPADPPDGAPWQGQDDEASDGGMDSASASADDGPGDGGGSGGPEGGDASDGGDAGTTGDGGGDTDDPSETGETGDTAEPPPPPTDVPDNPYCQEVADWNPGWVQLELDVLELVNEYRASGANCGSEGSFGPAPALTMNPALLCAARKHSKDMNDRMFFDHTNPSGESPWDRMGQAGYSYSAAGENIAGGSPDAAGTMNQWMNSDGHCANIMNPSFEEIGVGYHPGGQWGHLWTQAFGSQ